ncbi:MAG: hypothetical protein KatS3mg057_1796 [Herpetosiphonaceae bacterium]|nr:MAG: hypothetical protein KatS3mg057_1796 [Herpetosiphonaceae bacterium]
MRWQYALKTVVLESLNPQEMREFESYLQGFGDEGFEIISFHLLPHKQGTLAVVLMKRERPQRSRPIRQPGETSGPRSDDSSA